ERLLRESAAESAKAEQKVAAATNRESGAVDHLADRLLQASQSGGGAASQGQKVAWQQPQGRAEERNYERTAISGAAQSRFQELEQTRLIRTEQNAKAIGPT